MENFDFIPWANAQGYINLSQESTSEAIEASKNSDIIHIPIVNLTPSRKISIPVRHVMTETIEAVEECLTNDIDFIRYAMICKIYSLLSE